MEKGELHEYRGSLSILKGSRINSLLHWDVARPGIIYWTNGENIYRFDCKTQTSRLIYSKFHFILEFFLTDSLAYIVYNPSTHEDAGDNRYSKGSKFCYVNLITGIKKEIQIPPKFNFTNLSISPNQNWASFIYTLDIDHDKTTKYDLVLYNLRTQELRIIDSAKLSNHQWFGDQEKTNSSFRINSDSILYSKHT